MIKIILLIATFFTVTIATVVVANKIDGTVRYVSVEKPLDFSEVEKLGYQVRSDRKHELKAEFKKTYTQTSLFTWSVKIDTISFSVVNYPK